MFLPLGFAGGFVSQFFLAFSLTVTFALLASLDRGADGRPGPRLLPRRPGQGRVDETGEPKNSFWVRLYDPAIRFVLRSRWTKVGTVVASRRLFVASITHRAAPADGLHRLGLGEDRSRSPSRRRPAPSSEQVLERAAKAEAILLADPDVELVATSVPGEGDAGFQTVLAAQQGRAANSAQIVVRLDSAVDLEAKIAALDRGSWRRSATDGYEVTVGQQGGAGTNSLSVVVSAEDPAVVAETAEAVLAALDGEPGLANLTSDLVKAAPEVQVRVDPNRAIGVGPDRGPGRRRDPERAHAADARSRQLDDGDAGRPRRPRSIPASVDSVEALRDLPVGTTTQGAARRRSPTSTQADVQGRITRIDEAPSATISAEITSGDTGATSLAVQGAHRPACAPTGPSRPAREVALGGVTAQQSEAFGGLFAAMGIAILLVYLVMVLAFNSLITPFIILFSLPLATIGAFPALLLTGRPIGLSALIGFLMLIGIVVTNAIVLLDLVERLRADGHSTRDALIEGGRTRIRPILMTAIATILALVPAGGGLQRGLDHRGRARDRRHRRPAELDVPDAARRAGRLLAGRRPQAPDAVGRRGLGPRPGSRNHRSRGRLGLAWTSPGLA